MTSRDSQRLRRRRTGVRVYVRAIVAICGLVSMPLASLAERDVARPESAPDCEAVTPPPNTAGASVSLVPRLGLRGRSGSTSPRLCAEAPESTIGSGNQRADARAFGMGARPVARALTLERTSRGPPRAA